MAFTNINDPAGVKALLDQLRSSQAWQEAVVKPSTPPPPESQDENAPSSSASTSTSIASLLSQLQTSTASSSIWPSAEAVHPSSLPNFVEHTEYPPPLPSPPIPLPEPTYTKPIVVPSHPRKQDLKSCTFQQALPHLAQLSDDQNFVSLITQLKEEQADLERQLWAERCAIQKKYEEKVKVERTKATMIGTSLSKHEADMLSEAFRREVRKFDLERVLPTWDGLIAKQQAVLESHKVPTMSVTTITGDRERQQRVIQVLEGL